MAKQHTRHSPPKAGAWAVIYCAATGKFLLGKRSGAVSNSGAWNLFGGRVHRGEEPCEALMRELAEEAGLRVKPKHLSKLKRVAGARKNKSQRDRDLHYYLLKVERELVPRLNHEHSGYGWFTRDQLPERFNLPTTVAIERGLLGGIGL